MSRIPAHLLAVVRCRTCGSRNATDAWRRLRGARAKCGRCGAPLPFRIPWGLVAPVFALSAFLLALAAWGGHAWKRRSTERMVAAVRAEIAAGRHEEAALRLLEGGASPAQRRAAAAAVASELLARAAAEPDRAEALHGRGDALMARHAEEWPELLRELAGPLQEVAEIRDAVARAGELAAHAAAPGGRDLPAFEREWERGLAEARRWAPRARELFAVRSERAWAVRLLEAARAVGEGSPSAAAAVLRREGPERAAPAPGEHSASPSGAQGATGPEVPELSPEASWQRLDRAIAGGRLEDLWPAVHLRAGESWGAGDRQRLDERLRVACLAMASVAATSARDESDPHEAVRLWERALTCDELLPADFRREALAALALEQVAAATRGSAQMPSVERLVARLPTGLREGALGVSACRAEEIGRPELAVAALKQLPAGEGLVDALRCEVRLPSTPAPRLDYPSEHTGGKP